MLRILQSQLNIFLLSINSLTKYGYQDCYFSLKQYAFVLAIGVP